MSKRIVSLRNFNIQQKVLLMVIVLGTIVFAALVSMAWWSIRTIGTQSLEQYANNSVQQLAISCEVPLSVGDIDELQRILARSSNQDSVLFAVVLDVQRNPLTHVQRHVDQWVLWRGGQTDATRVLYAEAAIYDVIAPDPFSLEVESTTAALTQAQGEKIGTVILGLSLDILKEAEQDQILAVAVVIILAASLTFFAIYIVFRGWQARFQVLLAHSRKVANGDYTTAITELGTETRTIQSADEIGILTRVFDEMRQAVYDRDVELRDLNRHLQDQVELRTSELEDALIEAKAQSVAKSHFLANTSHEIRTPMNGILGMGQILEDSELNEDQTGLLRTMMVSGDALLSIINDILDFSKIESGKLDIENITFSLRTLLADVLDIVSERAQEKGLVLTSFIDVSIPDTLESDPVRIRQIMLNLLSNAIKFTNEGEVCIHVSRVDAADPDPINENGTDSDAVEVQTLRFEVIDTGIGIAEAKQQALFHAFTQADASTTRIYGGTGLGLSISKKLSELLGGSIGVESVVGEGACFFCEIPVGIVMQAAPDLRLQHVRVLSVDARASVRAQMENILETLHCDGSVVSSRDALLSELEVHMDTLSGDPYDVVMIPSDIAEIRGIAVIQEIKSLYPHIAMVYMAEIIRRKEFDDVRAYGVLDCVTMPLRSDNVGKVLRRIQRDGKSTGRREVIRSERFAVKRNRTFKILLAEDNVVNQKVAKRMLETINCTVDVVDDGVQAYAAAQSTT